MIDSNLLTVQTKLDALAASLRDLDSQSAPVAARLIDPFLSLPGLVGFWPMSSIQRSTGNAYDLSGQGRTLTYNGNPTYNIFNGFVPYIDLDGTGDYLSRADETDLDILGTETVYASTARGLTLGGWFWMDNFTAATQGLIGKNNGATNNRSYLLLASNTPLFRFQVSVDGVATVAVDSATPSAGGWYFLTGRFLPSTELALWTNGVKTANTTSIPASIFNGNAALEIGNANAGTLPMDGRAALCFLSANAIPEVKLIEVFNATRRYFGV